MTVSLKELGLRIQLGHRVGEKCVNPDRSTEDEFVVLDHGGIHTVCLDFCGCGKHTQSHTTQLLRVGWFPASVKNPRTAATFRLLSTFELLSYESKISTFEFYQALARLTDNTGMKKPKVCQILLTKCITTLTTHHRTVIRCYYKWFVSGGS